MATGATRPRFGEATLSDCDREPIHVPGSIQPHGCLLAVDGDGRVVHAAGEGILPIEGDLLGRPLADALGEDAAWRILALRSAEAERGRPLRTLELAMATPAGPMDVALHESGGLLVVEAERASPSADPGETLSAVHGMLRRVEQAESLETCLDAAASEVRRLTGFDRVMVYRFLADGSGTVAAEDRLESLESFRGLRYPASDIPRQARDLYVRNPLRLIPDVDYVPAPIRPGRDAATGEPLDLTHSTLRSVSPIHVQYLKNLGVAASMSISIVRRGELWGLIACHHGTPWHVPSRIRQACELFAQVFSMQINARLAAHAYEERLRRRAVQSRLVARLTRAGRLADGLSGDLPLLLELVPAQGVAMLVEGRHAALGETPAERAVEELVAALVRRQSAAVFATDSLADALPEATGVAGAGIAGVLAIPVSATPRDYLVWFRPEVVETVTWAGDPRKAVQTTGHGSLTPRASFAAWQETVRGRAEPFGTAELDAAEGLRVAILEVVVRHIDELARERAAAQERQSVLLAELDHRVKNILANIQALMRHTRRSSADLESYATALDSRIKAMALAQSLLSESRWRSASLARLAREEFAPYDDGAGRVVLDGPDVALSSKAALSIAMALHELATNAAKYGALSASAGRLAITWRVDADGLRIAWRERGGPPVAPPSRRGFGSTLIEGSLAYELGGEVDLRYPESGVECDLFVPARFVVEQQPASALAGDGAEGPPRVLVVEDSMIFAFDLGERLRALGFEVAGPTGRLEEGLAIAAREPLSLALLDVNLGDRDSFSVADALAARGVPFLFLTGYDARTVIPARFAGVPCLSKPVGDSELAAAVRRILSAPADGTV